MSAVHPPRIDRGSQAAFATPLGLLAIALLVSLTVPAVSPAREPGAPAPAHEASTGGLADSARVRRWREDLRFITARVRERHPRPFAFTSASVFDSATRAIDGRIATTDDARLAVECMRMVALLGDAHTLLIGTFPPLGFTSVLPVWLRPFEDGLYLAAADSAWAAAVGARVTRIGDVSAEEALSRLGSATSGDNRYTRLDRAPLFLMMPAMLHALGICPDRDRVALELERPGGAREQLTIVGGAPPPGFPGLFLETEPRFPAGWVSARRVSVAGPPRCDRRPEEAWWFERIPGENALYLRLRRIDPVSGSRASFELFRGMFAALDSLRPEALIVDLRHDHGGNNSILDPLVRGIVQRPWLDREGGLFALVDRGTFSAAMNAAVFLEDQTHCQFVGEPTGGRPNHYGDAPERRTPNFGMLLQVSTLPWFSRDPSDDRSWLAPSLAVPSTFADWRSGGDAALDAALDAVRTGTQAEHVLAASRRGGGAGARAQQEWVGAHPNPWGVDPGLALSAYCAELLERGEWRDAIATGETLVEVNPRSWTGWRRLGEAHAAVGNTTRAAECLREALKLNPRAEVARMMLLRMGETP